MSTVRHALESPVFEALGWALVHFVWQGAVLAGLMAVLLVLLRSASSQIKYLVQCSVLSLMAACPLVTWWVGASSHAGTVTAIVVDAAGPVMQTSMHVLTGSNGAQDKAEVLDSRGRANDTSAAPLARSLNSTAPAEAAMPWTDRVQREVRPVLPWMVALWLLGVVLLSLRLLVSWRIVQRLKRFAVTPAAPALQLRLKDIALRMRVSRPVKLMESALIEVPTVIGWLRPVILIPGSILTNLTPLQLEAVLAHELAHIHRHDYLVNLIQTAIETLLFYHPAAWWLSTMIRNEREHCCDDLAVSLCDDRVTYVVALAAMEELRNSPALTVAATGGSLLDRVRRIAAIGMDHRTSRLIDRWPVALLSLMTLIGVLIVSMTWSLASPDEEAANAVPGVAQLPGGKVVEFVAEPKTISNDAPANIKQAELDQFSKQLREIAPSDWTVERCERAFRLLGPQVGEGQIRASILLWFDDVSIASSDLDKRDRTLPRIGVLDNTRVGRCYVIRNRESYIWDFVPDVRKIEPVDHIAKAGLIDSEVTDALWFDAAFVRDVEVGPDGRRLPILSHREPVDFGITAVTKFLVVGKLPDHEKAVTDEEKEVALRHFQSLKELQLDARRHEVTIISVAEFETYAQQVMKDGRGAPTRWIKDPNQIQPPECLTTGENLVLVPIAAEPVDRGAADTVSEPPPLEFRFAAQPANSNVGPRVPADFDKRHYPDNTSEGQAAAQDTGFVWMKLANPKDHSLSLPLEADRGADVRVALLADSPQHALLWDGTWSVDKFAVVADEETGGQFSFQMKLNDAGGAALLALTKSHLNQQLAIVINGEIITAPTIVTEIGREFVITGNFTRQQANNLAKTMVATRGDSEVSAENGIAGLFGRLIQRSRLELLRKLQSAAESERDRPSVENRSSKFSGPPLDRKVAVHFKRTPLIEVLTHICQAAELKLELDATALKFAGYTRNMAVTIDVDNITLRDALTRVLKPYNRLSFTLDGEQIFVSDRQRVEARKGATAKINPNGEIVGRLVDAVTGKPVEGATIACGAVLNDSRRGGGANTLTDADGRYRMAVPSPGIYNVWLKKFDTNPQMTAAADDGVLVEAGKAATADLRLVAGRKVAGKVIHADGKPFADVSVGCYSAARPHSGGIQSFKTRADGTFEFFLPAGRACIYVSQQVKDADGELLGARVYVNVSATGDPEPITLALQPSSAKFGDPEWLRRSTPGTQIVRREGNQNVSGTVVDEAGNPVAGAKVFRHDGPLVPTDDKGEFHIDTSKGTQFVMYAFAPGYHIWTGAPTSGDVLKIVMEPKQ